MLTPGTRLGPYEILGPIGSGGMGEVYKALDTRLGRVVAIKLLMGPPGQSTRLQQEARAIAALNHPNICSLYDVGPDYLVMEHVEGSPLNRKGTPEEVTALGIQIAAALEEAHAHGILHRDLKPSNILLTPKGSIKLLDFGLAKLTGDAEQTLSLDGSLAGTAAYMSPEQAQGQRIDCRSDIFGLGIVLYEMLSGTPLFRGKSVLETLNAVVHQAAPPLAVPPVLAEVVSRCLKKSPEERFATMAEVRAALERIGLAELRTQPRPSIAVLPFANLGRDVDDEYFSDGLAEEIINLLAKIPGLKVIARTSAFVFKGKAADMRTIAETLGVSNVLEGGVRRSGNHIRVTAQLVSAGDGSTIWSERYDRELVDVFAVQDEISTAITGALQVSLSPNPTAGPVRRYPNIPAYEALLKARHFHWKLTPDSLAQAKGFYDQAIALDPQYALAHAYYADYLFILTTVGMSPMRDAAPAARALAARALELDPKLPEAHAVLGVLAATYDYDWTQTTNHFQAAMAGEAVSAWCHMCFGEFALLCSGRRQEALVELERAVQADPLHLMHRCFLATTLASLGQYEMAEMHLRQAIALDANFFVIHFAMAALYAAREMIAEALPFAETALALAPWDSRNIGVCAGLWARRGETARAAEILRGIRSPEAYGAPMGLALYHCYCGEAEAAAGWLEKAIEQRDSMAVPFLQSGIGTQFRLSPQWPMLASLINLPGSSPN